MTAAINQETEIAPGVVETIVVLAVRDVPGVIGVGPAATGFLSALTAKPSAQGVAVEPCEDGTYAVSVNVQVSSAHSLTGIANQIREDVADAVLSQAGLPVSRVDILVDGIRFEE